MFPDLTIVTGAGRGIGKALALAIGKEKTFVLCISKTNSCEKTSDEIKAAGGQASAICCDLNFYREAHDQVASWLEKKEFVRIGVITAASILGPTGELAGSDLNGWEKTLRVNLLGNLAVIQAALPVMKETKYGRIIMFSGGGSAYSYPIFPAYSASKTATVRAVENLACDLTDKGDIAVVCLAPGAIETDMLLQVKEAGGKVNTLGKISEVINCVQAILSTDTKMLSGRFIHVRDDWQDQLKSNAAQLEENHWKLRRIE